jgi:hypothetical protein
MWVQVVMLLFADRLSACGCSLHTFDQLAACLTPCSLLLLLLLLLLLPGTGR